MSEPIAIQGKGRGAVTRTSGRDGEGRVSPTVTLWLLALASLAYALQQTLVVPALPLLGRDLHTSTTWVTWVFTGFLLSSAVLTPLVGKLGDTHGKKRLLVISLVPIIAYLSRVSSADSQPAGPAADPTGR